jgi:hypothetical protein
MAQPYKNWTKEEDQRLLAMRAAGKGPVLVAKELRRTGRSSRENWRAKGACCGERRCLSLSRNP